MPSAVVDSSVIIAYLRSEPGGDRAAPYLPGGLVSAVNLAEVASKMAEDGMAVDEMRLTVSELGVEVVAFTADQALETGALRPSTRAQGLSVGDRACLVLARQENLAAVTADRRWAELDIGVEVVLIR